MMARLPLLFSNQARSNCSRSQALIVREVIVHGDGHRSLTKCTNGVRIILYVPETWRCERYRGFFSNLKKDCHTWKTEGEKYIWCKACVMVVIAETSSKLRSNACSNVSTTDVAGEATWWALEVNAVYYGWLWLKSLNSVRGADRAKTCTAQVSETGCFSLSLLSRFPHSINIGNIYTKQHVNKVGTSKLSDFCGLFLSNLPCTFIFIKKLYH